MSKIRILAEEVANQIAAGEVVERPASVVKELVENAIDAQSRKIFVALSEEGVLRVLDDGEGMDRLDAEAAFQRHATSKLKHAGDLYEVTTLGFRGEALPSIAAVSKVRLVTQQAEADAGTEIFFDAGKCLGVKQVGAPTGSCFEIRDLFFNTPARKKFLKSAQTELSHIRETLLLLALAHPHIHFRLTHRDRTLLDVPFVSTLAARALQLFGGAMLEQCMETDQSLPPWQGEEGADGLRLKALFSRPPLRKNYRKDQYLFVNGRPIKSPVLLHALYDAYEGYLMKGEHPFFVVMLSIPPACVDVNVHPTKREVRFQYPHWIHEGVRSTIRAALSGAGSETTGAPEMFKSSEVIPVGRPSALADRALRTAPPLPRDMPIASLSPTRWIGWPLAERGPRNVSHPSQEGSMSIFSEPKAFTPPAIRPLGQVYATFIVAEIDGELTLIDQHAMHERLLYESFMEAPSSGAIQPLLIPREVSLLAWQADLLREHLPVLAEAGFAIESFGPTAFLIREVPAAAKMNLDAFLSDLAESLREGGEATASNTSVRLETVATMACHSAIRAGQSLQIEEMHALLSDYFKEGAPPTCPHGRPILMRYPLLEMERLFRRK